MTELRVRADWGFIRFVYLPLIVAGLAAIRFLPAAAVITMRAAPCVICYMLARWGNHVEEAISRKPILQITDKGLTCEDGEEPTEYGWDEITGVAIRRRSETLPWKTGGSIQLAPPYWLTIIVRDPDYEVDDGAVFAEGQGYAERRRRPEWQTEIKTEGERLITLWPRQVQGGLFSLVRFAKELQLKLIERANRGEIPCLLPEGTE